MPLDAAMRAMALSLPDVAEKRPKAAERELHSRCAGLDDGDRILVCLES